MEKGILAIILILSVGGAIVLLFNEMAKKYNKSPIRDEVNQIATNTKAYANMNYQKVKKSAEKHVSQSYLTGCSWILASEQYSNVLFTFRSDGELLVTTNGRVERCSYELIVDNNSLLITRDGETEHYMISQVYNDYLFLNKLSSDTIMVFANHTKFKDELKSAIYSRAKELV
jgi:hypothetical protein